MKIQGLAIIFIIIILPISILVAEYSNAQIETLTLQISYDTKLQNATYDAIKAFQINTLNNSVSDLSNSKVRDIEASVSTFYTSLASNFNLSGYNEELLKEYIPAIVYTMYDGYYIYSPYENTLTNTEVSTDSTYQDGEITYGLKPYIYYSCRYVSGTIDVVITYSLENYITVQGTSGNDIIDISGYLIDDITQNTNGDIYYRGILIEEETLLSEYIGDGILYNYVKIDGVKYYNEPGTTNWFSVINGEKYVQSNFVNYTSDDSAINYYKEALEFEDKLFDYGLLSLKTSDAVDSEGNKIESLGDFTIFDYEQNGIAIEEETSSFNQHRKAVIQYSIEKNLSTAISNYNDYMSADSSNFSMPELNEFEWETITDNITVISFMQGMSIGGKVYNGYSVVANNLTEEFVSEESIYIVSNDTYYTVNDSTLQSLTANNMIGIFNVNFQRKTLETSSGYSYYYPNSAFASYGSIVGSSNRVSYSENDDTEDNIYDYVYTNKNLAKIYYTALGRERYSMYSGALDNDILSSDTTPPLASTILSTYSDTSSVKLTVDTLDEDSGVASIKWVEGNQTVYLNEESYGELSVLIIAVSNANTSTYLSQLTTNINLITDNVTVIASSDFNLTEAKNYDVIIYHSAVWTPVYSDLNSLYAAGLKVISIGNDTAASSNIIKSISSSGYTTLSYTYYKSEYDEITKNMNTSYTQTNDGQQIITFEDDAKVLYDFTYNGIVYDAIGYMTNGYGKWIHIQPYTTSLYTYIGDMIYKVSGERSTVFDITQNGTYSFIVTDFEGNKTTVTQEVTNIR